MKKYPKLRFQINIDLDIDIASHFMDIRGGGIDFGSKIVDLYPELSKAKETSGDERKSIIADFTQRYYSENKDFLEKILENIKIEWESSENYYFEGVDKIFNHQTWPDGDYICFLSIFNCNPRFLETKSFQVYKGLENRTNYVIAHEMLHFMFFDYLDKEEVDFKNTQDENTIWLLSEWFNDLVLNLPVFKQFGENVESGYPEVAEFSKQLKVNIVEITEAKSFFKVIKTGL